MWLESLTTLWAGTFNYFKVLQKLEIEKHSSLLYPIISEEGETLYNIET
jgi:hypothetical protein